MTGKEGMRIGTEIKETTEDQEIIRHKKEENKGPITDHSKITTDNNNRNHAIYKGHNRTGQIIQTEIRKIE